MEEFKSAQQNSQWFNLIEKENSCGAGGGDKNLGGKVYGYILRKYVLYLNMPVLHRTLPGKLQLNFVQGVKK